jgi:hypothetical protein
VDRQQSVNRHRNGSPVESKAKALIGNRYVTPEWGHDRRPSGPHPEWIFTHNFNWLRDNQTRSHFGAFSHIALVAQHHVRVGIILGHEIGERGAVVSLARRQKERYRKTLTVGPGMDFGRKATARAAKSLVLSPPLAPAAQWCARMTVLSTICTASLPPPSASASSIRSQRPLAVQRRHCRCTEFHRQALPADHARAHRFGRSRTPHRVCVDGRGVGALATRRFQ